MTDALAATDPADGITRATAVGQALLDEDPNRPCWVWEMRGETCAGWVVEGVVLAMSFGRLYGMVGPVEVPTVALTRALHTTGEDRDSMVAFDDFVSVEQGLIDLDALEPCGGMGGLFLRRILEDWLVDDRNDDIVLAPVEDVAAPPIRIPAAQVPVLHRLFCFGDDEWVTLALTPEHNAMFLGHVSMMGIA